jgi:hypothetical protein
LKNWLVDERDGDVVLVEGGGASVITQKTDGEKGAGREIREDVCASGRGRKGWMKIESGSVGREDGLAVG